MDAFLFSKSIVAVTRWWYDGDMMVMTIGEPVGKTGGTNTMKIIKVGDFKRREQAESV